MLVKIDNDRAVDMLLERLEHWTDDYTTHKLYESRFSVMRSGRVLQTHIATDKTI